MSRLVPLTKIVITGNKGGTGKTTIAALLAEYLNHLNKKVQLVDTDPNQALQAWINNCVQEKRPVSSRPPVAYQIGLLKKELTGQTGKNKELKQEARQQQSRLNRSWFVSEKYCVGL